MAYTQSFKNEDWDEDDTDFKDVEVLREIEDYEDEDEKYEDEDED